MRSVEMDDPTKQVHPAWGILLLAILLAWLTITLWSQATTFDSTEGRSILAFISPLVAGWAYWFYKWSTKGPLNK